MKILLTLLLDAGGAGSDSALRELARMKAENVRAHSSAIGDPGALGIDDWRRLAGDHGAAIASGLGDCPP
jgi:hypothetical protein